MRKSAIALSLVVPLSGFAFFVDAQLNSAFAQGAAEPQGGTIEQTIEGHYRYENGTRVSGLIVTDDGIVVVDGLSNEAMGQDERRLIAETFEQPVRYLVSSTFHNNYTRGNVAYGDVTKIGQELYKIDLQDMMDEDRVGAAEQAARLPDVTYRDQMTLHLGGKEIQIIHIGPAHTRGDSIVFVPEDRIVYVSELLFYDRFPWMNSGYANWIDAIDTVLAMDADIFVPGQGPMTFDDPSDSRQAFIEMRQILADARDAVQAEIAQGASEAEALERVTLEQYRGFSSYDRQIEVVVGRMYRDLQGTLE
jgi:glyoxylase-like metal-dependent hydrolase (beta-lactamase superfamily II)